MLLLLSSAFAFLCFSAFPLFPLLLIFCFSASLIVCFAILFLSFRLLLFPALIACCFSLVDCFPLPLLSFLFFSFCDSLLLRCSALTLCLCINTIAITITVIKTIKISSPPRNRKSLAKSPSKPSSKGPHRCKGGGGGCAHPPQHPRSLKP